MSARRRIALPATLLALLLVAPAAAVAARGGVFYADGPAGRVRLGGTWGLRLDPRDAGTRHRWYDPAVQLHVRHVTVPSVWNARVRTATARGGVAWYVKRFVVGSDAAQWRIRFGSTQHLAVAWVDGRPAGRHRGGFLPWETPVLRLAPGVHELRVRIDNRASTALVRTGGYAWWNWGGPAREVELRPVHGVDLEDVTVLPRLLPDGDGTIEVRALARNADTTAHRLVVRADAGGRWVVGDAADLAAGASAPVALTVPVARPRHWGPRDPYRYPVHVRTQVDAQTWPAYDTHVGFRTITASRGRLLLDGRRLWVRGISLHEQRRGRGDALRPADWARTIARLRRLGVNAVRAQYPLHPGFVEALDRAGILLWADAPFGWVTNRALADRRHRDAMLRYVAETVRAQAQHPSIWVWGIGNELAAHEGAGRTARRFVDAAAATARALDPTRLVGLTTQAGRADAPLRPWAAVDVLGVNAYLGWYGERRMPGSRHLRSDLRRLLHRVRHRYPAKPVVLTEFGAEGAARGPATRRGTYAYQAALLRSLLREAGRAPSLDGAIVWALQDFAVRPGWRGGNFVRPRPPYSLKGLLTREGRRKPAFGVVAREMRRLARRFGG